MFEMRQLSCTKFGQIRKSGRKTPVFVWEITVLRICPNLVEFYNQVRTDFEQNG